MNNNNNNQKRNRVFFLNRAKLICAADSSLLNL